MVIQLRWIRKVRSVSHRPNKRFLTNQAGFTLIETFLVLTIFFILMMVTVTVAAFHNEKKEIESFLLQLSKDLSLAQAYALNEQTRIEVYFQDDLNQYVILKGTKSILTRSIPTNIRYRAGSLDNYLVFNKNSHVPVFGTWTFSTKNHSYVFVVLIGRGRHYYYQEI